MKKSVYKVLAVITALCVLLGVLPVVSFAEEPELEYMEDDSIIRFSPETELEPSFNTSINRFYSVGEQVDAKKYFYNQLTATQKKIYDAVWAAGPVEQVRVDVSTPNMTAAHQDILLALTALNEDNPLFFWLSRLGFARGSGYLIIAFELEKTDFSSFDDVKTKQNAVIEKLATIKVNGISRHEKVKSIHDYLANNIAYDYSLSQPNIYDVYGALLTGLCVCEGYAEAFKLLCDREGIPCITVTGTGGGGAHKWNMVQMEDGEWYTLDSTWDDQDTNMFYSYFLIGSGTKAPFFNYSTVADSTVHIQDGKIFSNANTALSYPILSTDTYGVGMLAPNATDIHFDKTRGVIMVGKGLTTYYNKFVDPDYYNLTTDFNTTKNGTGVTKSTLDVTDGVTSKTYLVAMRGDIDANNRVNATDFSAMEKVCTTTQKIDNATAKFYAGDMNQDGAIDGFDAIAHQLYTQGTLTFD